MTEIEEKLLALAADCANLEPAEVLESISAPAWEAKHGWCDWQLFVPKELEALWPNMSNETRLAVYFIAAERAEEAVLRWEP
jgi:hypothetical protein